MVGLAEQKSVVGACQPQGEPTVMIAVSQAGTGQRLDHWLVGQFPESSRSALHKLIETGHVLVDGQLIKAGRRLRAGETVSVSLQPAQAVDLVPEQVDFPVLFEDDHILVISKPPGLVVHPACGHSAGTLVHGLLYRHQDLPGADAGRPGIVHRLDKDTSGVMLVAKNEQSLRGLMADFKDRKIRKTYHALLLHSPRERDGRVVAPIGRHPIDRKKMAIRPVHGRYAATHWHILEYFSNGWCFAEIGIETGRTHQIRVHMASVKAPVAGDVVYGGAVDKQCSVRPTRQLLHASTLRFSHPATGVECCFTAPLWEDMQTLLDALRSAES